MLPPLRSRRTRWALTHVVAPVAALLLVLEFLVYYVVLFQCSYPDLPASANGEDGKDVLRAMFLADTHLLGRRNGHWFDKLRREWQMRRAFQTAMAYFRPELVVFLGDVFDEGKWAGPDEWEDYLARFSSMFAVDEDATEVKVVIGNHDVGFHYAVTPFLENRFEKAFDVSPVDRFSVKGIQFVSVNSMAMEGDGCFLCKRAEQGLRKVAKELECIENRDVCEIDYDFEGEGDAAEFGRPVLLQHFPLYRESDAQCTGDDAPPDSEKEKPFRDKFDCVSKESSDLLLKTLRPRLILSGHTHHGCLVHHAVSGAVVPEYSVSSFSWRNRNNPTFLLAKISPKEFRVEKCFMPQETTVIFVYEMAGVAALVVIIKSYWPQRWRR